MPKKKVTVITDGTITPYVTATDAAGNVSSAAVTPTATMDVDAPTATVAVTPDAVTAKVGDTITATFTAGSSQNDLATTTSACTINTVDVKSTFVNGGAGSYTLTYVVTEGNIDRLSGALPIDCTLAEPSGNTVTVNAFVGNTLVVDANTPTDPVISSIATDNYISDAKKSI